jgi:hypothetical protein
VVGHPPHQLLEDGHRPAAAGARVAVVRAEQQSGNLVHDGARGIPAVCLRHQPDPPSLLLDRAAVFAHIDKAPDRVGEVEQARTGSDALVPVDQSDRLVTNEDGVVRP